MKPETEGLLLSSHCMLIALLKMLAQEGALPPAKMQELMGDAQEVLAGLKPDLMSASGRELARAILQRADEAF